MSYDPVEIEQRAAEDAMNQGYYGFLDPKKRATMSLEKLVIELSKLQQNSPAHVLLAHELNLRLAKEQAKATISAGWLGAGATVLAVFISVALGYLAGVIQTKEVHCNPSGTKTSVGSISATNRDKISAPSAARAIELPKKGEN